MKKLKHKMLLVILPFVIAAMVVLMLISVTTSRSIIETQISQRMTSELEAQMNDISQVTSLVNATAQNLSIAVQSTYKTMDTAQMESMLKQLTATDSSINGCGIWFAPYAYDAKQQYVGPYAYKNGNFIDITYDYSNAEYDYFSQE